MTIRYRAMDANGDYVFGLPPYKEGFLIDSVEAVAQAVLTRLKLSAGEWFLDVNEGTPYETQILGFVPVSVRDFAIRQRLLDTLGVKEILSYSSDVSADRIMTVNASLDTIFGQTTIDITL